MKIVSKSNSSQRFKHLKTGSKEHYPEVEVRYSSRRRKTASASWEGERIVLTVPATLHGNDRAAVVDALVQKLLSTRPYVRASDDDLILRAKELADQYLGGVYPTAVQWSKGQLKRWGSCTAATGTIRISERLKAAPSWVIDGVLLHELAHLIEPNHSERFKALTAKYPRMAEVQAFLEGFSLATEQLRNKV